MSKHERHPLARLPILTRDLDDSLDGAVLQICNDVLAIFILFQGMSRVIIWHWIEGVLLVVSRIDKHIFDTY